MLEVNRKVFVARVLLRVLEKLSAKDADQEWLDLYAELKPYAESHLRERVLGAPDARS